MLLLLGSYLLGSLPCGLWIARAWAGIDIRERGSGNIGATNIYREVGRVAGVLVFLLDMLKGLIPPLAAAGLGLDSRWQVAAGMAGMVGHSASPFLGFKGGKGISTALGVLFGVQWKVALAAWALWGVAVWITGMVSVGSLLAAVSLVPFALLFYPGDTPKWAFGLCAATLSIYKHRANIRRILNGTEHSFRRRANPVETAVSAETVPSNADSVHDSTP